MRSCPEVRDRLLNVRLRTHPPAHLPRSSIRPYGPMITAGWGHFRPSQPPRRVDRWAQLKPSRRHLTDSQVGPPRAVTLGPDQAVTARKAALRAVQARDERVQAYTNEMQPWLVETQPHLTADEVTERGCLARC